ncbi:TetR/AcrR family transcriptional regulator [Fusibacter bizertensis]
MMQKTLNPAYILHHSLIVNSLIELMKRYRFQEITIKQIVEEADVSRQTFYRHFSSKEEIVEEYSYLLCQQLTDAIYSLSDKTLYTIALTYFKFWNEQKELLYLLKKSDSDFMLFESYKRIISKSLDILHEVISTVIAPEQRHYVNAFLIGGFYNVKLSWMEHAFKETPEEMAMLIVKMIN